jgi:hypothetical protein
MRTSVVVGVCLFGVVGFGGRSNATPASDPVVVELAAPQPAGSSDLRNLLSDQVAFGSSSGSRSSPRTGFITDRLSGSNDLNPSLGLLYAVTVTQDLGARATAGAPFPERGGTILHLLSGLEWQLSRRWALIPTVSGSLPSTTQTSISVPYQDSSGAQTTLAGDLRVKASSVGGELSAELDTLDAGPVELVFTMTGGLTNYWIAQALPKLQMADGTIVSSAALQPQCQTSGCSQDVLNLLSKPSTSVIQVYAEGDVTASLGRTDVGITGSGYVYSQDPGQLGFFGIAGFARGPSTGDGYPMAPLLFDVRGHVLEKLGAWRLAASGDYGRYVDAEGWNVTGSLKATYSVTKQIRLWATGTFQRDRLVSLGVVNTMVGAIGLRWSF